MSVIRSTASALVLLAVTVACAENPPTSPATELGAASFDMGQSGGGTACVLNTQLRPENEVPASSSTAKGHAQIKVRNDGSIEWKVFILNKDGETFTAGHIHVAPEDAPGPVVLPLYHDAPTSERQIHDRGETEAGHPLAQDLCEHPENYYVNYHTTTNRPGAIRGQLGTEQ